MKKRNELLQLRVNPILCDGFGHCAELAPDLVILDELGYPIFPDGPFSPGEKERIRSAHLAIRGCPRQALVLERLSVDTK